MKSPSAGVPANCGQVAKALRFEMQMRTSTSWPPVQVKAMWSGRMSALASMNAGRIGLGAIRREARTP